MQEVIDRLSASKMEFDSAQYSQGEEAGRFLGKYQASASELFFLEKWRLDNWRMPVRSADQFRPDASEQFVRKIRPSNEHQCCCHQFWESQGVERDPTDQFVHGFAMGALEIWCQVKDEI
jgi:hypothetical protein